MLIAQILKYFNIIFKSFTFSIKFILKYYITIYHLYLYSPFYALFGIDAIVVLKCDIKI